MRYQVDFLRHGGEDSITFDTRADAEAFVSWGQHETAAFIRAEITEVDREVGK